MRRTFRYEEGEMGKVKAGKKKPKTRRLYIDFQVGHTRMMAGDVVVVSLSDHADVQTQMRVRECVMKEMPAGVQCLVLQPGVSIQVLRAVGR